MKKLIMILLALALSTTAWSSDQCQSGHSLSENLRMLGASLKAMPQHPEHLETLCTWIDAHEVPYLKAEADFLDRIYKDTRSKDCFLRHPTSSRCHGIWNGRHAVQGIATSLNSTSPYNVVQNLKISCDSFRDQGYSEDVQFFLDEAAAEADGPATRASLKSLLTFWGCDRSE
jgi:hypothetical protein